MRFWVHLFKGSKENNIILNKFLHQVQLQILMNIFEVRVGCQYFSSYWLFCYLVLSFSIFIFWYIYIYIYISYPLKFRCYWFSSVIIYVTKTKSRHFYPNKFLSISYFNILFNISVYFYCVNFFCYEISLSLSTLLCYIHFSLITLVFQ